MRTLRQLVEVRVDEVLTRVKDLLIAKQPTSARRLLIDQVVAGVEQYLGQELLASRLRTAPERKPAEASETKAWH